MIFEDVKILDSQDLFFECDCSKEKMKNALMTVGKDEIQAMIDEDHGCDKKVSRSIIKDDRITS